MRSGLSSGKEENGEVVMVDNGFSYLRTNHRNDDKLIIIQDMEIPSQDLRCKESRFFNDESSKVEMMVRLNKLQNHFVHVVAITKW
jgi:hypothetical protein